MTLLPDAHVAAIARPGESWASARQRADRLHRSVRICRPCPDCDVEEFARLGIEPGWIDEDHRHCPYCSYDSDNVEHWEKLELSSHTSDFGVDCPSYDLPVVIEHDGLIFGVERDQIADAGILDVLFERVLSSGIVSGNVELPTDQFESFRAD